MALRDQVLLAYPIAIQSQGDIVFEVFHQGTIHYISFRGVKLFQFDQLSVAQKFVDDLNDAVAPIVVRIKDTFETQIEEIINNA